MWRGKMSGGKRDKRIVLLYIILICGCVWRGKMSGGKRDKRIVLYIILLGSLYYFIRLYVKKKKNWYV